LVRAAIYEIADEDHLPLWMPENAFDFGVVELPHQAMQSVSVTVDVADQIVSLKSHEQFFRAGPPCRPRALNHCGAYPVLTQTMTGSR
jgi:hypothetical protein